MNDTPLLPVIIATAAIGLIPFLVITTTAFLKISIVLFLVRNALGTQQTPPTLVMYAIAIVLTAYVSAPLASEIYARLTAPGVDFSTGEGLQAAGASIVGPWRVSLERFTPVQERDFLLSAAQCIWPPDFCRQASSDDLLIVIPAYVVSELTRAFQTGFLLYLPFIAVDLIVSNVLMAMGMVMVSPLVISTPFKILLFVLVSGWTRLLHGLVLYLSAPVLGVAAALGLIVGLLQAVTQIQDQSLPQTLKLVAILLTIGLLGPLLTSSLVHATRDIFDEFPVIAQSYRGTKGQ